MSPHLSFRRIFFLSCLIAGLILHFKVSSAQPGMRLEPPTPNRLDTLTIIHVNDTHSNLMPFAAGRKGGLARAATIISRWKMDASKPVLVHCGDLMVGTLMFNQYFGVPELQILNQLGFDAFLLGNHEFDVGAAQLGEILKSARLDSHLKILCSNLRNLNGVAPLDSLVHSHLILKRGHLQIGLLGLTTPNANLESNPAPLFIDTSLVVVAQREIKSLKEAGCQVIIMLSHLGLPLDRQLATFLSGVDAIVGGHSHDVLKQPLVINGIPVVQAGEFYRYVGRLRLLYDGQHTQVLDYKLKEIDETVPEVPWIAEEISRLKSGVVSAYSELLGHPYHPLARNRKHLSHQPQFPEHLQSSIGRLVTAALHAYVPEADCALEPAGHIVEDLYPGEVTPADLFRIYPYGFSPNDHLGFRIATLQLRGKAMVGVMEALTRYIDPTTGQFDYLIQAHGLTFKLLEGPEGLVLKEPLINDKPIHPDSLYTIVTSSRTVDYLQNLFGIKPHNLRIYPVSVVQVINEFVKNNGLDKF